MGLIKFAFELYYHEQLYFILSPFLIQGYISFFDIEVLHICEQRF
jgi:hypothetical protein